MNEPKHNVLTIQEVADYLKIPVRTAYKIAQEGKLPGKKVGRHWRFLRSEIDHWLQGGQVGDTPT